MDIVNDDRLLAAIYSACDVFAYPTLAENLPNGVLESMACGTPVVAFEVGGVPDAVRSHVTGQLASYRDVEDMAGKISHLLNNDEQRHMMSQKCREVATAEYGIELQATRYESLYQEVSERARTTR